MVAVQVEGASITLAVRCESPASPPSQTDSQNECPVLSSFSCTPSVEILEEAARNLIRSPPASYPEVRGSVPSQGPGEDGPQEGSAPKEETWSPEPRGFWSRPKPRRPDPRPRRPSQAGSAPCRPTPAAERGRRGTGAAPRPAALTVAQLLRSAPGRPLRSCASGRQPRCCSPRAAPVAAAVTATVFVAAAAAAPAAAAAR